MEDKYIAIILVGLFAAIAIIGSVGILVTKGPDEVEMAKLGYTQEWTNITPMRQERVWVKHERK